MSIDKQTFVIAGASPAGARAAQTLRDEGFDGRVLLVGAEPDRTPLSKEYLRGEADREKVFVQDATFYPDNDIEVRVGETVIDVDPDHRQLTSDSGERVTFDRLLLATGAEPRRLTVPGSEGGKLAGDRIRAGMNVNVWDVSEAIQALIHSGEPIDERRLADPGVPLMDLIAVDEQVAS